MYDWTVANQLAGYTRKKKLLFFDAARNVLSRRLNLRKSKWLRRAFKSGASSKPRATGDQYERQLARLIGAGMQVDCIETEVRGALNNLSTSDLRDLRSRSVGSEVGGKGPLNDHARQIIANLRLVPELSPRQNAILARYIDDMQAAVIEVARVLTPKGKAVYVVGENTIQGTFIPNAEIVKAVARHAGLKLLSRDSRDLPSNKRYLPPPSARSTKAQLDNRLRREVVMTFCKARTAQR